MFTSVDFRPCKAARVVAQTTRVVAPTCLSYRPTRHGPARCGFWGVLPPIYLEIRVKFRLQLAALATAVLLAACGGGDPAITSVKVMGDSLSDSGTFGLKFTVQGSAGTGAGSTPIWPELVADDVADTDALCAYYRVNPVTQAATVQTGCTNYAVGGGRINHFDNPQDPRSITLQLQQAAQVHGSYKSSDLLLVDGGGNDAADLAGA